MKMAAAAPRVLASLGSSGIDAERHLRDVIRRNLARWRAEASAEAAAHGEDRDGCHGAAHARATLAPPHDP